MGPHRKDLFVCVTAVLLCCVSSDEKREAVRGQEGDSVALSSREDGCDRGAQVVWMFGPQQDPNLRIARLRDGEGKTSFTERFQDRLQLDHRSGSLSITGLRLNDSGVYMCRSIGVSTFTQQFSLTVYAAVSAPSIRTNGSETSCSSLLVECSVPSSRELRLSWFRGGDRLNETSSPDSSSRLRLSLLVLSGDEDQYSCVAENPLDQKSSRLHTEDTCLNHGVPSERLSWCHTEATVRLLLSAVLGLALMVLVADHIRFGRQTRPRCREPQNQREENTGRCVENNLH